MERSSATRATDSADLRPDYEADDLLVVREPRQLKALGDELRSRIVFLLRERARSITELAGLLGLPKGTVAHHVKVLERAGLVRVVRTRRVRALTERYYGRVARLFLFDPEDPADASAVGATALRQAAYELERGPSGATFGVVSARLTAADARRFERRIERLLHDVRARDGHGGEPHGLAVALYRRASDA